MFDILKVETFLHLHLARRGEEKRERKTIGVERPRERDGAMKSSTEKRRESVL